MTVSMMLGLEWGLDRKMTWLGQASRILVRRRKSSLIGGLVLLPGKVRVVPPPWIVRFRIWVS
jgi:hypothetical protein